MAGQVKTYALESVEGLRLHNVTAAPATLHGKKGVRLTLAEEAARRLEALSLDARLLGADRLYALATGSDESPVEARDTVVLVDADAASWQCPVEDLRPSVDAP